MRLHTVFTFFAALSLATTAASAQIVSVRAEGVVDARGSSPSKETKERARQLAKENAWKRYQAQNSSGARAALFISHAESFRAKLDELCSFEFYDEYSMPPDAKRFSVRVNASCNQGAIDATLNALSGAAGTARANSLPFTFVFLARRASDSTAFIDKVTINAKSTTGTSSSETIADMAVSTDGASLGGSVEGAAVTTSAETQTKGTVQKRDTQFSFVVEQSEGVDNAVTNVLATAGYDVAKYSDVIGECPGPGLDEVVASFANPEPNQAELLPSDLRRRMVGAAKAQPCSMAFFAVGILDILKAEEQQDGDAIVTVALTIEVRDIRKVIPTAVASIPRVQYQQRGRDRIEAANKALTMAAEDGVRQIVDMLRQRGL